MTEMLNTCIGGEKIYTKKIKDEGEKNIQGLLRSLPVNLDGTENFFLHYEAT